ncbi:exosome complex protein Rrp42, partial [Candidatus Pacearchaeota archaeon]|nr:exosome complex protein Rrp42 [Candidatus Pacearchaeota archaeon]
MEVTRITKKRIVDYLNQGKRFDNRELLKYRELKIETGISKNAEGSARVILGETEVLAGVKMDVMEPFTDHADEGILMVAAELSPLASENFESGPPKIEAIELARIIDRGLRESGFIDFKKLGIVEGEKVWAILLDIYPLNDAGNLIDASAIAVIAALLTAVFPKYEDERVLFGEFTDKKLPLTENMPLTLTFHKIGKSIILDPISEEEESSESRMSVAISLNKKNVVINALQKGKAAALTQEEIFYILDNAAIEAKKLHEEVLEK